MVLRHGLLADVPVPAVLERLLDAVG